LDLSNNQIHELPPEIGMMVGLNSLNVNNNQLADIPLEMSQLKSLTQFDSQGNNFTIDVQQKLMQLMNGTYPIPQEEDVIDEPKSETQKASNVKRYYSTNKATNKTTNKRKPSPKKKSK
jgi:Leucine-rich repeat (LRR) protein